MNILKEVVLADRVKQISASGIRVVFERAEKLRDVIRLEVGEPDFDTPAHIRDAAVKALNEGYTHYTSSYGLMELREEIAHRLRKENRIDADSTEVIVTAGASCALYLAIMATINPGDEVLVPNPAWPHYEYCVRLASGIPIGYPISEKQQFRIDPSDIKARLSKKSRMIIINSPSNPTGSVFHLKDLEEVAAIAQEHNLLVLSDEVYDKITYENARHYSIASLPGMKERTITINSFSKTYAMTGWRLGYATARREIIEEMAKLNLYTNSCASSIAQKAGVAALRGPQDFVRRMVKEYNRRRVFLVKHLNELPGVSCITPEGAFYAFPNISGLKMSSSKCAMFLLDHARVATVPGSAFGAYGEGYLRISYATSIKNLESALMRIKATLKASPIADKVM
jgi:aspartate/methionine/tyrosine aminotransferase